MPTGAEMGAIGSYIYDCRGPDEGAGVGGVKAGRELGVSGGRWECIGRCIGTYREIAVELAQSEAYLIIVSGVSGVSGVFTHSLYREHGATSLFSLIFINYPDTPDTGYKETGIEDSIGSTGFPYCCIGRCIGRYRDIISRYTHRKPSWANRRYSRSRRGAKKEVDPRS